MGKKGYEVHNFSHRGFCANDILYGGKDSNEEYHEPMEELKNLCQKKGGLEECVFILQAGGGNDLLKGHLLIAPSVATVIHQLSEYSSRIIVNNRYPIWPDKLVHKIVNFYLSVTFLILWNGIMQKKKLVLANLHDRFPNESDVSVDGLHLVKDAVLKQVDLYDEAINRTWDWNQKRTSFPEMSPPSSSICFATWCCTWTGCVTMLLLLLLLVWCVPVARPILLVLLLLLLVFCCSTSFLAAKGRDNYEKFRKKKDA